MSEHKLQGNKNFGLEVVGEAYYQNNFENICGQRTEEGENRLVEARLILEPGNQFDNNAVRVEVSGMQVGYLPRAEAKDYTTIIKGLKIPLDTIIIVNGNIRGGWKKHNGDLGHYGIWLDFPTDEQGAIQLKEIARQSQKVQIKKPLIKLPLSCLVIVAIGLVLFCIITILSSI